MNDALLPARGSRRLILICLTVAVAVLFGASISYRLQHPGLVRPSAPQAQAARDAMPQADTNGVTALMERLQANPQDAEALQALAEHFLHVQDWAKAENFALRTVVAAPGLMRGHYILGVALHGQARYAESAQSLEKALTLEDDPALRYSLAMLYAYYLKNVDSAVVHLQLGLANAAASGQLRTDLQSELDKLTAQSVPASAPK